MLIDLNVTKDAIVPIIIGVLSSAIFLFLASRVVPRLEISPKIAKVPLTAAVCSNCYLVKVVNKSKWPATEIRARLAIVHTGNVPGGPIHESRDFYPKYCPFELPAMG